MGFSAARLTMFAIISSIEEDLREQISIHMGDLDPATHFDTDTYDKTKYRLEKETGYLGEPDTINQVIDFADFSDAYQLINQNKKCFPSNISDYIKTKTEVLDSLAPIRNRVYHERPLRPDDLPFCVDEASSLAEEKESVWSNLRDTLNKLNEDPSFVNTLSIPDYYKDEVKVNNNLPIPDFDETGFVGRENDVEKVTDLCIGDTFPIITVRGEGGIGKTALALKVGYDIVSLESDRFDCIVWSSSKTTQLTSTEIEHIDNSISSSLGVFKNISDELSGRTSDPEEEVLSYLDAFNILLIIDNLETVLDERVKNFLENFPANSNSKILITSRVGVGPYERPHRLKSLKNGPAIQLLRSLAKSRDVEHLTEMPNSQLSQYCDRMNRNPLWIKWFVTSVSAGTRPEDVLENPDTFLEYCRSNVYDHLSDESKKVLDAFLVDQKPQSIASLSHLTDFEVETIQRSVQELRTTHMVDMSSESKGASYETKFQLADLARDYLIDHHSVSRDRHEKLKERKKQLDATQKSLSTNRKGNVYEIDHRTRSELVSAKYLRDALNAAKQRGDYEDAERLVDEAEDITPSYYEVYRVRGWLKSQQDNLPAARRAYDQAIELEPGNARLHLWYGQFFLNKEDDPHEAKKHFDKALDLNPDISHEFETRLKFARTDLYLSNFGECKQHLDQLNNKSSGDIDEWSSRKMHNLYLQYYRVLTNNALENNNYNTSKNHIEDFRDQFSSIPRYLVDRRIKDQVGKMLIPTLTCIKYIINRLGNKEMAVSLADDVNWIRSFNEVFERHRCTPTSEREYNGEIKNIIRSKGYGFISSNARSNDIFLHRTEFCDYKEWVTATEEMEVEFSIVRGDDGPEAVNATLSQ